MPSPARTPGRLRIPALMLGSLLAAQPSPSGAEDRPAPASESITLAIKPGKPGAPTERITVRREAGPGGGSVRVARTDERGGVLGEETLPLSAAEGAAVWSIVDRERLRGLVPEVEPGDVSDFGEVRLRIETRLPSGAATEAREVTWERPLRADEASRVRALWNHLAGLAGRAKTVRLAYLRAK